MTQQPYSNNQSETDGRTCSSPRMLAEAALTALEELGIRRNLTSTNAPKLPSVNQQSTSVTLAADEQGKKKLTSLLLQCFDALKVYGKEPEQLGNLNAMFQLVLEDYSIEQITEAFKVYISRQTEIPAPADIVSIIKRGNKPPFDKAVYIRLEKKGHDARSHAEDEYMRDYEQFQING